MRHYWFPIRKRGIFRPGKEIKGLRGGVHRYAAQANPKIDAARAEKNRFRMETNSMSLEFTPESPKEAGHPTDIYHNITKFVDAQNQQNFKKGAFHRA